MKKKVTWITRTAAFVALLIICQLVTASFGNKLLTGSLVNLILIISVMTCGLMTGMTVAILSPIFAKLVGIGPFWVLIPFIILGNLVLIVIWHYVGNKLLSKKYFSHIVAVALSSVAKFVVLYIGVATIAVPLILKLPEPKATIIANIFSLPQLFTAIIGGLLAAHTLPFLQKAIKKPESVDL